MEKLRWGIMATGKIARTFAGAVKASETGALTAVGSRTAEAANSFADEFEIPNRHGSYQALVDDPSVDAIYISLPNHLHAEWTTKCAEGGKHILCEKPFTVHYGEAMLALEAVRRNDVFFMEAFMYRCHPQTEQLVELLKKKSIGEVRLIQAHFSYNMGLNYSNIRMSNPAAGGGIMDVGCYTMSMARLVAGAEPLEIRAFAHLDEVSRVDSWSQAVLRFPGDVTASLTCGTQVAVDSELRIWGSEGNIRVPNPWFPGESGNRILVQRSGEKEPTVISVEGGAGLYSIEADTVARWIQQRQAPAPCMTWQDTLGNQKALDSWRRGVGLVFDAEKSQSLAGPPPPVLPQNRMKFGQAPGVDKKISRLVMGTMVYHSRDIPYCSSMMDYFVSLGGNCIDTARVYGGGESESAIGEWMRLRGNREELVLIAKGAHPDASGPRVSERAIDEDITESLRRLRTTYIDLYLLHRDDTAVPVGEIVEWLNAQQRAGRIKAFGGSNWTVERLQAANEYAKERSLTPFAASSPNFSLAVPNAPRWTGCVDAASAADREWYRRNQMPLFAWSSQAGGFFTGRFSPEDRTDAEMTRVWYSDQNFERLRRVKEMALRRGATTVQIALAYVLSQPFPVFALIGPQTVEETRTSAAALEIELTPEEVAWLNLESARI